MLAESLSLGAWALRAVLGAAVVMRWVTCRRVTRRENLRKVKR
jgi:hypothetical protein